VKHIPNVWNANTDCQFVLDSYAVVAYCSSYMTKLDKKITTTFKRIQTKHEKNKVDIMQTISRLGKALVNMQQMSAQQAVHTILALPLNSGSRQCIFINTLLINEQPFLQKHQKV
jgi:hypothetical protein